MKTILFSLLFVPMLFSPSGRAHEGHHDKTEKRSTALPTESIYNLSSKWTNQDGKTISLKDLKGKNVVLAMAYTSCEHACPLLIEDMRKIESKLPADKKDHFLFAMFSFDSDRDTPAKLKAYAQKRKLDLSHWELFHGDPKAVRELAGGLGIQYSKEDNGDFDHSNVISLVDSDGVVRYQQTGLNQDPTALLSH